MFRSDRKEDIQKYGFFVDFMNRYIYYKYNKPHKQMDT